MRKKISAAALTFQSALSIIGWSIRVWRSLVSRLVRVQEAVGSNPVTRTKKGTCIFASAFFAANVTFRTHGLLQAAWPPLNPPWREIGRKPDFPVGSNPVTRTITAHPLDTIPYQVGVQFLFAKVLVCKVFRTTFNETRLWGSEKTHLRSRVLLFLTIPFNERSVVCAFFQQVCASFNDWQPSPPKTNASMFCLKKVAILI